MGFPAFLAPCVLGPRLKNANVTNHHARVSKRKRIAVVCSTMPLEDELDMDMDVDFGDFVPARNVRPPGYEYATRKQYAPKKEYTEEYDSRIWDVPEEVGRSISGNDTMDDESVFEELDNKKDVRMDLSLLSSRLNEIQERRPTPTDTSLENASAKPAMKRMTSVEIAASMRAAQVIQPHEGTPYNALTAIAETFAYERCQFPFTPGPLVAIQEAFKESELVNCVVCKSAVHRDDVEENGICDSCYSKLFLQLDPVSGGPQDPSIELNAPVDIRVVIERVRRERFLRKRSVQLASPSWSMAAEARNKNTMASNRAKLAGSSSSPTPPSNGSNGWVPPPYTPGTPAPTRPDEWAIRASVRSLRTINPIRNLVQGIDLEKNKNPALDLIKLSVGDPTVYENLKVSQSVVDEYCDVIRSGKHNGYSQSMGNEAARTAVAARYTTPNAPVTPDDVILATGTSGALELAIGALANEGDNILLPQPGFPLFRTIAEGFGIECRYYGLKPNQKWEVDLSQIPNLVDGRTAALIVNNPSNPCGSVYSCSHVDEILSVASSLHLPVIADEVYADMTFEDNEFTSFGVRSKDVPVLCVGGMSKQFVVPGWRLGWVLVHDRNRLFERGNVRRGLRQLTTRMMTPNTPTQAVLPKLLKHGTEDAAFKAVMTDLETNAQFTVKALANAPGLRCIAPQGAMYVMIEVDCEMLGFEDDMHFTRALLEEQSVFVLPGQCFQAPNFIRIVFSAPQTILSEAFSRIRRFCSRRTGSARF